MSKVEEDGEACVAPYEVLRSWTGGLTRSDVRMVMHERYNARVRDQARIEGVWRARVEANPRLFNGSKFRLASVEDERKPVTLRVGLTDYKSFLGTNCWTGAAELLSAGASEHGDARAFMADALGVGAIVITADDVVVFIRRSMAVGEAAGLVDCPGGHPEPKSIGMDASTQAALSADGVAATEVHKQSKRMVDELFDSILAEVRDEVNIPRDSMTDAVLLGFIRNTTTHGRPSACFQVRVDLSSKEVAKLWAQGGAEADESTHVVLAPVADLLAGTAPPSSQLAPAARGCIHLWKGSRVAQDVDKVAETTEP